MVVSVITDEAAVLVVRREETTAAIRRRFQRKGTVIPAHGPVRSEELLFAVELECSRVLLFVSDVRRGSGRHHYGAGGQFDFTVLCPESHSTDVVAVVDQGFFETHVFDE